MEKSSGLPSVSRLRHQNCDVDWHVQGSGRPLILLHGGFGNWRHWVRNIDALAAQHKVCVPDLPGYGDSDDPQPNELLGLLAATRATLDTLVGADTEVDLAGFSFGAIVATHLASQRGRVRKLAPLGAVGHGGPRRARGELLSWRDAAESGDLAALRLR